MNPVCVCNLAWVDRKFVTGKMITHATVTYPTLSYGGFSPSGQTVPQNQEIFHAPQIPRHCFYPDQNVFVNQGLGHQFQPGQWIPIGEEEGWHSYMTYIPALIYVPRLEVYLQSTGAQPVQLQPCMYPAEHSPYFSNELSSFLTSQSLINPFPQLHAQISQPTFENVPKLTFQEITTHSVYQEEQNVITSSNDVSLICEQSYDANNATMNLSQSNTRQNKKLNLKSKRKVNKKDKSYFKSSSASSQIADTHTNSKNIVSADSPQNSLPPESETLCNANDDEKDTGADIQPSDEIEKCIKDQSEQLTDADESCRGPAWRMSCKYSVSPNEEMCRKVRAILNKLTPQNFDALLSHIQDIKIDTENKLETVVEILFKKAIVDPRFSEIYAKFCRSLRMLQVKCTTRPNEYISFREILAKRCQEEFEGKHDTDTSNGVVTRRPSEGNVRFIVDLFKLKILTENDMYAFVSKLLQSKDEEKLEYLCCLLMAVGNKLKSNISDPDSNKTIIRERKILQQFCDQMKNGAAKGNSSSRVWMMLQEILEFQENNRIVEPAEDSVENEGPIMSTDNGYAAAVKNGFLNKNENADTSSRDDNVQGHRASYSEKKTTRYQGRDQSGKSKRENNNWPRWQQKCLLRSWRRGSADRHKEIQPQMLDEKLSMYDLLEEAP